MRLPEFARRPDIAILAGQGVSSVTALLSTLVVVRALGLDGFGLFSLAGLVLLFFQSLQHALVVAPAYSLVPKLDAAECPSFRGFLLLTQLALGAGFLVAAWLATLGALPLAAVPHNTLVAAATYISVRLTYVFFRRLLFVDVETAAGVALRADLVAATISILGIVGTWRLSTLTLEATFYILAFATAVGAVQPALRFGRDGIAVPRMSAGLWRRYVRVSRWLLGVSIAGWLTSNSFPAALAAISGTASLGAFRAAQTLVGPGSVVIQSLESVFSARASRLYETGGGKELRRQIPGTSIRWSLYLVVALAPAIVAPALLIELVVGAPVPGSSTLVRGLCLVSFLALFSQLAHATLRAGEVTRPLFVAQVISAAFGVVTAAYLVRALDTVGCLIGLIAQQLIVMLILAPAWRAVTRGKPNPAAASAVDGS
jgi:O-antigen/teichoic acid export membrane protein